MFKLHRTRSRQAGHPPRKRSRVGAGVLAAGLAVTVAATGLGVGLAAGPASAAGTSGKVSAKASTGGVPATGVTAAVMNTTMTNTTGQSFLTVWPTGVAQPVVSDLNCVAGQTVPNLVVVELGSDGAVQVLNAAGSTDVVVDVMGWYS